MAKENETEKSFEEKLLELENIVKKLESTDVPLKESINMFERGTKLAKELEAELKNAELKIKKVVGNNNLVEESEPEKNNNLF